MRDGYVYILGSQFGKKAGPLSARRSWIARVSEDVARAMLDGGARQAGDRAPALRPAPRRQRRARRAPVDLLPLGPLARERYIDATIETGEKDGKRWAGRIQPGDQPINVEAAEFRADGRLLLGLRYPVTADGHPLLVEIHDVERCSPTRTRCRAPATSGGWRTSAAPQAPAGFRGARHARRRSLRRDHRRPRRRQQVRDGARGPPRRRERRRPSTSASRSRRRRRRSSHAEPVHHFGDIRRVEGVAIDHEGHAHYVIDEEGHVALRTLVIE